MSNQYQSQYAFPVPGPTSLPNDNIGYADTGMGLLDYFAAKALPCVTAGRTCILYNEAAEEAYRLAHAMMRARVKEVTKC